MWQTFRSVIEDDFIDEEDIIAKIQYLENLTSRHPYIRWANDINPFSARISAAIQTLPDEHQKAALAIFANIIYIPSPILTEAWREVALSLEKLFLGKSSLEFSDTLYLSVDDPGLVTDFSHIAGLKGREDHDKNPGFNTISDLIDRLYELVVNKNKSVDINDIVLVLKKKNWVVLSDNSISGGSLASDIKKLERIKSILLPPGLTMSFAEDPSNYSPPLEYVAVQIATQQALSELDELIPTDRIAYGIKFDDSVRIESEKCKLFHREETLKAVRRLCEWFGNEYFLNQPDPAFRTRIEINVRAGGKENYAYGWKDGGYTIVTENNALSNSAPIIYYTPPWKDNKKKNKKLEATYIPPFPRIESRISHMTSKDRDKLSEIEKLENATFIRSLIYGGG